MKHPKITVYIPCHNYGKFLELAIESVIKQSIDDWELIVIDDGSTDNTSMILENYDNHPKIRTYYTKKIGLPSVCNFALEKANGDYIIRLDGDDIFDENILLVMMNYLENNKDMVLVFPDYYLIDELGKIFEHERRELFYQENHLLDIPPHGACTLIRINILKELGGYREDLGAQDGFDLWSKIKERYKVGNVNLPLFFYRRHESNLTNNNERIFTARRQIKKDVVTDKLDRYNPILAVIPCREYFDFQKDLWKVEMNGETLLEKDIKVCLSSSLISKVIVACDNDEAKAIVDRFDSEKVKFFKRDYKSTSRSTNIVPMLTKVIDLYDPSYSGICVLRYIQTPFVSAQVLDEAITSLIMYDGDSSWGVRPITRPVFRRTAHGLEKVTKNSPISTDLNQYYQDSQTFSASRNYNLKSGSLTGRRIVSFEVSAEECFFMSNKSDLEIARRISERNE